MIFPTILVQAAENEGLTIGKVLADIPHDGPAILMYLLTAGAIALIWWGHRRSSVNAPASTNPAAGPGAGGARSDAGASGAGAAHRTAKSSEKAGSGTPAA